MFCKNCGQEIDDKADVCVHCGVKVSKEAEVVNTRKVNVLGIIGFVVALLSLWLSTYYCIASIVGIILSAVAMGMSKKYRLNGFAIAGLVISIVSLLIWGIILVLAAIAIMAGLA